MAPSVQPSASSNTSLLGFSSLSSACVLRACRVPAETVPPGGASLDVQRSALDKGMQAMERPCFLARSTCGYNKFFT